ncbi:DUF2635 domain-containing protein [Neptunomonas antarctica]|uniref:DUF2635 domain-containing protein n=1 Tax=Neptunomonas antarctica TaxID=619304 RepID=A0A1N7MPG1_9GAMM|nr:DUF2635 domain-containing protein [Neptunomonas antarctica]SIS87888.1 Protein of unknown function [Neptunomonas antarctica]
MQNLLNVRPNVGQVRKEDGSIMPADGCRVPNHSYYRRRLRDGDLLSVGQAASSEQSPQPPAAETAVLAKNRGAK